MFDTHSTQTQKIKFNAVSGSLIKSCRESFFIRFHLQSQRAKEVFVPYPEYDRMKIVVLQTMIVGENEVLCEIIEKKAYESLFEGEGK